MTATTGTSRILIDSSGWLEYLTADTKAAQFESHLINPKNTLIVPTVVLYEVRKKLLAGQLKIAEDWFLSEALRHTVVPLDERVAIDAAAVSLQFRVPMADAIIYTTAVAESAQLITGDAHFGGLPNVTII
ncbi:MAG: type II toxin-antitoxin system VapC family toxin [Acidobacteria bacterium]|nr:type II toxin-antitoxin system VapC family toxin [Acidobacteriota bacterium]MBS1864340.1 type II toxin-antitoxin system VapC family toxin [Acidobacteriota bacterium]